MNAPQLLESIITDLGKLADNYQQAGFLEETRTTRAVSRLIGEREAILAFRRLFLLTKGDFTGYFHGKVPVPDGKTAELPGCDTRCSVLSHVPSRRAYPSGLRIAPARTKGYTLWKHRQHQSPRCLRRGKEPSGSE